MKKFLITLFILLFFPLCSFADNTNDINVAFNINSKYTMFSTLVINSILVNNKSNSHYHFYIVEDDLNFFDKRFMTNFVKKNNQDITFIHFDKKIKQKYKDAFGKLPHLSTIAMARIYFSDLLPNNIDKVLYLDADILVTKDLKELYNTDLGNNVFGMVPDNLTGKEVSSYHNFDNGYFNSGVILMDLNESRQRNLTKKFVYFYKINIRAFKNIFLYTDQDLINIILDGEIKELPANWNFYIYDGIPASATVDGIIHFIGPKKPWNFNVQYCQAQDLYYEYWEKSSLKNYKKLYFMYSVFDKYTNKCKKIIKYNKKRNYRLYSET